MSAPQGLFYFSGIQGLLKGSFALTDDVQPSLATIYIPPQDNPLPAIGDFIVSYGGQQILFPQCRVQHVSFDQDDDGHVVWALTIADARWRWKYYRISGDYNLRDDNDNPKGATNVIKDSRDLATLLFKALKVDKFDLGDLPSGDFPEKHWDYDRADVELSSLCSALGCRIVPQFGGSFKIVTSGVGDKLPKNALTLNFSDAANPPELPESIVFVCGPDIYQHDFELEAVGKELDGTIKPIDELSYKPKDGWESIDLDHFSKVDENSPQDKGYIRTLNRDIARKYVFRLFRIKVPFTLPGVDGKVKSLKRILPITDRQIFRVPNEDHTDNQPALVYGNFYRDSHEQKNNLEEDHVDPLLRKRPQGIWRGGTNVICEKGLVELDTQCYRLDGAKPAKPILFLRTSVQLRDNDTNAFFRKEVERKLSRQPNGTPKLYIIHDEISFVVTDQDSTGKQGYFDNFLKPISDFKDSPKNPDYPSVKKYADYFIDGQLREMQIENSSSSKYAGFQILPMDGAIRSIVWEVDDNGKAWTTIARNSDILGHYPSKAEREYNVKAAAIADKAKQQRLQQAKTAAIQRRLK